MAVGIITAICTYVADNAYDGIGCTVWDGEVHRYDPRGQTVGPESSGGQSDWPVIKFSLPNSATGGFTRHWTFEDPYYDDGMVICQVWHTTRKQAEETFTMLTTLLASLTNWASIGNLIPSPYVENPHYVIQMLLKYWTSYQLEGVRTQKSELLYTCEGYFHTLLHGAVPTA